MGDDLLVIMNGKDGRRLGELNLTRLTDTLSALIAANRNPNDEESSIVLDGVGRVLIMENSLHPDDMEAGEEAAHELALLTSFGTTCNLNTPYMWMTMYIVKAKLRGEGIQFDDSMSYGTLLGLLLKSIKQFIKEDLGYIPAY